MSSDLSLKGKVAVVTGSGRGIGRSIAIEFARAGASVIVNALHEESAERTSTEISKAGGKSIPVVGDVSQPSFATTLVAEAVMRFGKIDVLVNNVGFFRAKGICDMTEAEWDEVIDSNIRTVFLCSKAVGKKLIDGRNSGAVINIASFWGVVGGPDRTAYSAAKAAVIGFTRSLAIEWAQYRIRVNAIAPGYVKTEQIQERIQSGAYSEDSLVKRTPLGRMGSPSDVANAALFLASDRSAHITGQLLVVDGGWTAYGYV